MYENQHFLKSWVWPLPVLPKGPQRPIHAKTMLAQRSMTCWKPSLLIGRDYKIEWKHIKDSETNEQEEEKQDVNKDIPDFAPGQVELTEAHKRAGLTQKHINWINKHKQGMVITPRRNMTNNTRDFLMDQAVQAKKPGFRVSKTGKLYY